MTPSLEQCLTKAEVTPSPHEVRLTPLDTNPVFQMSWGRQHTDGIAMGGPASSTKSEIYM